MNTILITGSNRGIGLEFAKQYLNSDWHVIACCRDPENSSELKKLKLMAQDRLIVHKLDVKDVGHINHLTHTFNMSIDIVLNNAGIYETQNSDFGCIEAESWIKTFTINTISPLLIAQALINKVAHSKFKIIANVSSNMGSIKNNKEGGHYIYRSSKAALNAVTKSLAIDLKERGIKVVSLHPGWVKTDMGGSQAEITTQESVQGMKRVLENLTIEESGSFINYDGNCLPW